MVSSGVAFTPPIVSGRFSAGQIVPLLHSDNSTALPLMWLNDARRDLNSVGQENN
jgi:hypothetical protein